MLKGLLIPAVSTAHLLLLQVVLFFSDNFGMIPRSLYLVSQFWPPGIERSAPYLVRTLEGQECPCWKRHPKPSCWYWCWLLVYPEADPPVTAERSPPQGREGRTRELRVERHADTQTRRHTDRRMCFIKRRQFTILHAKTPAPKAYDGVHPSKV